MGAMSAGGAGMPMPNAFGGAPQMDLQALLGDHLQNGFGQGLEQLDPGQLEDLQRRMFAGIVQQQARARQREELPIEVRLPREVQAMGQQVRYLVAERQGVDVNSIEEDQELLDHIARTMAEARARGAPVPNPTVFVDR